MKGTVMVTSVRSGMTHPLCARCFLILPRQLPIARDASAERPTETLQPNAPPRATAAICSHLLNKENTYKLKM